MIRKLAASLLLVIAGTVPYILWHQQVAFLSPFSSLLPDEFPEARGWAGIFLRFHAADMAWVAALLIAQDAFIGFSWRNPLVYAGFATPFILELLQAPGIVPGTFDPLDLAVYLVVSSSYIFYKQCETKRKKHSGH